MRSCTWAAVVSTEWIRPLSLSTPICTFIPNCHCLPLQVWIPRPVLVFGRAWSRDDGGVDDRALLHRHPVGFEMRFDGFKYLLTQIVLLQQMPERQDRGLIRDSVADHVDPCETAHRGHLDQLILHGWVAEVVPLLQQVDSQHGCQLIGRSTTLGAGLGVVGLDQFKQRFPRHDRLHLCQKALALGALLGRRLLVITKSELLAAHHPSAHLRLHGYFRADGLGFPESP